MTEQKNILTLSEAMMTLRTDNDYGDEIKNVLPEIDTEIFLGTGIHWELEAPIYPQAKAVAKIKLRLALGYSINVELDNERATYLMKQLQAEASANTRKVKDEKT